MSYNALLKGRRSEKFRAYSITTVTHKRLPIFTDLYCARDLAGVLQNIHGKGQVQSLAWVLMPDHLHWLFQLRTQTELSQIINHLKGTSSRKINQRLGRNGHLWQKAFYDRALRDNEDIKQIARYIVANPLRAGLVNKIEEYPHWDAIWL